MNRLVISFLLLSALGSLGGLAQVLFIEGKPATIAVAGLAIEAPKAPVTGAPYSANSTITTTQTLTDGNQIQRTTTGSVARDSHGRVRTERTAPEIAPGLNGGEPLKFITIQDPTSGTNFILNAAEKTAHKVQPPPELTQVKTAANGESVTIAMGSMVVPENSTTSKIDLGTQIIDGVPAKGTRTIRTIPAGSMGNSGPIEITAETWYSPALQIMLLTKNNDPRIGETTSKLTNIQRVEPAPALFQIPADYTVVDDPGPKFVHHKFSTSPVAQ
jgi:hypothetical protein